MITLEDVAAAAIGESVFVYTVGCLAFVISLLVWHSLTRPDLKSRRTRMIAHQRHQLLARKDDLKPHRRSRPELKNLAQLARRLRLLQVAQVDRVREKLSCAGYRGRDALPVFVAAKAGLAALLGTVALMVINLAGLISVPRYGAVAAPVVGLVAGFILPDVLLSNKIQKRRGSVHKSLPDGLDLLVICAEAGLSLDAALARVSDEIAAAAPDLADELALTALELSFLPERRAALFNLAKRCDVPGIRGVVNTLVQTERYGTPLAQALRVLSGDLREERMMRAEEKAARLPAILMVPMIVFILPTLFVVLGGPAVISIYQSIIR